MEKIRLGVLFGGVSSEYEVSLLSASSILRHLDREKYDVVRIGITKDGRWLLFEGDDTLLKTGAWADSCSAAVLSPDRGTHGLLVLRDGKTECLRLDAVFPILHGKNGEDGTVQGLCALADIPCVGSDTAGSAVCMDKELTHCVLEHNGVRMAKWVRALKGEPLDTVWRRIEEAGISLPLFIKPARSGSSVGVSKARTREELPAALETAFREDEKVLIEETLSGAEVECAVMGNGDPFAAGAVGEIEPLRELYDYEGKYCDDTTALHIPARIPEAAARQMRETAVRAYRAAGCRGLSRVDFFVLHGTHEVVLNEINTLPGFTDISMYPKLFCHDGLSYGELLDRLIGFALESEGASF